MAIDLAKELQKEKTPEGGPRLRKQAVTFRQLQARNRRKAFLLGAVLVLLFAVVGGVLGGIYGHWGIGVAVGSGFALLQYLFARTTGSALVMRAVGAKPVKRTEDPQLVNVVEEMAISAGIPCPTVYLIEEDSPNAFATGFKPEDSSIAITTALREKLQRDELQGVVAHEIGHIRNGDTGFMVLMSVLVGSIALLCDSVFRGPRGIRMIGRTGRRSKAAGPLILIALILAIFAPLISRILQAAVSREREYLADATAVELTRHPAPLISALEKLTTDKAVFEKANRATQHLFIVNPLRRARGGGGVLSTHPPLPARIRRIKDLVIQE